MNKQINIKVDDNCRGCRLTRDRERTWKFEDCETLSDQCPCVECLVKAACTGLCSLRIIAGIKQEMKGYKK